jgi:hypothetical protein
VAAGCFAVALVRGTKGRSYRVWLALTVALLLITGSWTGLRGEQLASICACDRG